MRRVKRAFSVACQPSFCPSGVVFRCSVSDPFPYLSCSYLPSRSSLPVIPRLIALKVECVSASEVQAWAGFINTRIKPTIATTGCWLWACRSISPGPAFQIIEYSAIANYKHSRRYWGCRGSFQDRKKPCWFEAAPALLLLECSRGYWSATRTPPYIEKLRRAREADELGAWRSDSLHVDETCALSNADGKHVRSFLSGRGS